MDEMVLKTQEWLNSTYTGKTGYIQLDLDDVSIAGRTGWTTIYALLRAFQIELGITATANNFGPTTEKLFKQNYPQGIQPAGEEETNNVYGIIQGALWCKGYSTGHYPGTFGSLDTHFDSSVEKAIIELKTDAGLIRPNSVVTLNVMKALLSMDYFVIGYGTGGDVGIRYIQQRLNREYEQYIGLMPCDGVYGRNTNKALIYALQAEEGLTPPGSGTGTEANGNFGPTTKKLCPVIPSNGQLSSSKEMQYIKLIQYALYCNGFGNSSATGVYDTETRKAVNNFQEYMALGSTGITDIGTWMSLLISCGDTSRTAKAFDCATILTTVKAKTLSEEGYEIGGRYLTGTIVGGASKALSRSEMNIIFDAGLRFFPIFQTAGNSESYFQEENRGYSDAWDAFIAAYKLRIPENTIIYFAVDFDAMDYQIKETVLPYFEQVFNTLSNISARKYRVGVYGARNTCTQVCNAGYAVSSFVGDMSTGFSGNLGFKMPTNWAFDQFDTVTVGSGAGMIEIDKDAYSGRDRGVSERKEITVPSAAAKVGVTLGEYESEKFLDYTTPLNNLFKSAKEQAEEHRCKSFEEYCADMVETSPWITPDATVWLGITIGSFLWFYKKVNHNAEWDIKREEKWNEALPNVPFFKNTEQMFLFRGEPHSAEEMGNIMYGYVGRATGFGAITLYWGGGVAKQGGMNNDAVNTPPNYGDDENDHDMITLGYNMFGEDYPDYPEPGYDGIPIEKSFLAAVADLFI